MRSFLLPSENDPWRDWKINPIGNGLALLCMGAYIFGIVLPVIGKLMGWFNMPLFMGIFA